MAVAIAADLYQYWEEGIDSKPFRINNETVSSSVSFSHQLHEIVEGMTSVPGRLAGWESWSAGTSLAGHLVIWRCCLVSGDAYVGAICTELRDFIFAFPSRTRACQNHSTIFPQAGNQTLHCSFFIQIPKNLKTSTSFPLLSSCIHTRNPCYVAP